MGRKWGVLAAVGVVAALAGCGGGDGSGTDTAAPPSTGQITDPGPFFGQCGSVTDDEVSKAFGMPSFTGVTRNSVGCEWETAGIGGPSVTFSWYRGSPIGRERAGSELIGRPATDIDVRGHPGFIASSEGILCELGVEFGGDFIHWSVMYADVQPAADPCKVARDLAELSVSRAK
ncbi:DUF3558 domain-containing protein [Rhodococcus tibetensis]|uniref:DUF3558 domain-containing protein n=1 Tax=Rhodococcus tibetensis TaxID=2965064 RepID=A0ABT1QGC9_9NOCA|nr:DUF3558 domain-containing protein [Rhodococcus sp. FXJ9.536]MCQ4121316.1 DUF3558 domain-containing protein [Rhodococcus sp. FXJ9.536]